MKVSVLIATYGDEAWIRMAQERAFPSACEQGAHEVKMHHDPQATIAEVRNVMGYNASGDWLCFLDADDELGSGYLEAMKRALEQERGTEGSDPLLLTPAVSYVHKGRPRPPMFHPSGDLLTNNFIVVGTLVQRDLFIKVGGFGNYPHGFEDWSLWAKCAKMGARVKRVKRAIYFAHVNPQSKHR